MKSLFVLLIAMCVFSSAHAAMAANSSARQAISQKWNQVQKWQKKQDDRLKAIERRAERLLNNQKSSSSSVCVESKDNKKGRVKPSY
jgi:Ni/Co efflux regulator RcnB